VLAHDAIFFGFGTLLQLSPGSADRLGRGWWLTLPLAFALLPFALMLSLHDPRAATWIPADETRRLVAALGEAIYAWLMILGLMGLFEALLARERPGVRWVSDSAYWLYLVHLPLLIVGQAWLRDAPMPGLAKFVLLVVVTTCLLMVSYGLFVRHTPIGTLLNGPRPRKPRA